MNRYRTMKVCARTIHVRIATKVRRETSNQLLMQRRRHRRRLQRYRDVLPCIEDTKSSSGTVQDNVPTSGIMVPINRKYSGSIRETNIVAEVIRNPGLCSTFAAAAGQQYSRSGCGDNVGRCPGVKQTSSCRCICAICT